MAQFQMNQIEMKGVSEEVRKLEVDHKSLLLWVVFLYLKWSKLRKLRTKLRKFPDTLRKWNMVQRILKGTLP